MDIKVGVFWDNPDAGVAAAAVYNSWEFREKLGGVLIWGRAEWVRPRWLGVPCPPAVGVVVLAPHLAAARGLRLLLTLSGTHCSSVSSLPSVDMTPRRSGFFSHCSFSTGHIRKLWNERQGSAKLW